MHHQPPTPAATPIARRSGLFRDESGQVFVLSAVTLAFLLAIAALVIDLGGWYHSQREAQAVADAAALAGAQALPGDTATAMAQALDYAKRNGQTLTPADVTFSTNTLPNDTIAVKVKRVEPTTFAKVLGVNQVTIRTSAAARASNLTEADYAAPFAIINTQPELAGPGCPCYDVPTSLDLEKVGPGGFKILNVDGAHGGNQGPNTIADWIANGFDGPMTLGWYYSMPGAKFNSSEVKNALDERLNSDMLFPIYDVTQGGGANLEYHVIGWAAFKVTDYDFHGDTGSLDGWFEHVTWAGLGGTGGTSTGPVVVGLVG